MKFKRIISGLMTAVMVTSVFATCPTMEAKALEPVAAEAKGADANDTETIVVSDSPAGVGEQPGHGDPVDIGDSKESWDIKSPDGKTVISIKLTDKKLRYTVTQDGQTIVEESDMGIRTSKADFRSGLSFKSASAKVIHETYKNYSGIKDISTNYCNEAILEFKRSGVEFQVVVRAYNDGIGYRYKVGGTGDMTLPQNAESTSIKLPSKSTVWFMDHKGDTSFMYEEDYNTSVIDKVANGAQPAMPTLAKVGEKYALITEAEKSGTYVGSMLEVENGNILRLVYDPVQTTDVQTTAPFQSPWRTLVIGDLSTIVSNTMVENLSPAPDPQYKFEEWVHPGVSSWSWVGNWGNGISDQSKKETHMNWIDLAEQMGWRYYILDERWQPEAPKNSGCRYKGMRNWFPEVRDYADQKGVNLIAWVDKLDMDTEEEREERFKEWSEAGIKGIKIDFFYNEAQPMTQLHDAIYKTAAKYHMLVNVHGSNPPSGERRTYPNVIAREAIKGQEQGGITANQYSILPFTRGAVGTADVTEELYSKDTAKTSMGFQIALSILIENGIRSLGGKPSDYLGIPAAVSYYKNFPEKWDDVKLLETEIGEYTNIARKTEDAWYIGGISVAERNLSLKMDWLEEGVTYTAIIYSEKDHSERSDLKTEIKKDITKDSTIDVHMQKGGGYAIKLYPQEGGALRTLSAFPSTIKVAAQSTKNVEIVLEPADSGMTDLAWTVKDASIASVSATATGAEIKGLRQGATEIVGTSAFDESKTFTIKVEVTPEPYPLRTGTWNVINNNGKYKITGENSVRITAETGVIDKNVFATKIPNNASNFTVEAKISGGLEDNYQGAFIGVFNANNLNDYVGVGRRYHTGFNNNGSHHFAVMGQGNFEKYKEDPKETQDAYIRLKKEGKKVTGYYRYGNNEDWKEIEKVEKDFLSNSNNLRIGFYVGCGGGKSAIDVTFSDFTFNNDKIKLADKNNSAEDKETYTVEFDAAGGTGVSEDPVLVEAGQKVSKPEDPEKGDFKFLGWYAGDKEYNFNSGVYEDVLLTAKWEGSYEILTLEAEAGKASGSATVISNPDASNGYYLEKMGSKENGAITFNVHADIADTRILKLYFAQNDRRKFQVTVNNTQKVNVTCPASGGWTKVAAAPEAVKLDLEKGDNVIKIAGVGTSAAPNLDKVELELTPAEAQAVVEKMIEALPENVTAEHKAVVNATKVSYDSLLGILGAAAKVEGADKLLEAVETIKVVAPDVAPSDARTQYQQLADLVDTLDQSNYVEDSWTKMMEAYNAAKAEAEKGEQTDMAVLGTLVADLKAALDALQLKAADYTVTFKLMGGTGEFAPQEIVAGNTAKKPEKDPVKAGYTFGGWFLNGELYDFGKVVEKDIELVARWDESADLKAAKEKFENLEDAKEELDEDLYTEESWSDMLAAYEAAKAEYDKDAAADVSALEALIQALKAAMDKMEETSYTVTFDTNGGTAVAVKAEKVEAGSTVNNPGTTTKAGYTFAGWTLNGAVYDFNTPVTADITLVAKWNIVSVLPPVQLPDTSVKVDTIAITGDTQKVAYGKKIALAATVTPANAANKGIVWTSDNTAYATVSADGVVTTTAAGKNKTVVITATAADGKGAQATYTIHIMEKAVKKIKLRAAKTVKAGKKITVKATVSPKAASSRLNATLVWSSSNTKYATVNENGVVKTKKAGKGKTVRITAKSTDGSNKKATIKIKIK